ncbi:hypothetical protein QBC42DRAFT_293421 [Cladorrhinum samala]|uniref:Uncharacterized protein n=1 Tax=Cladorrhinum samala TaxID=585594 RepID=A0AAV9I140_9PEZI|nr:hypothetical protein QBC42DRAFT_293421 [Cladorrhinum samala]
MPALNATKPTVEAPMRLEPVGARSSTDIVTQQPRSEPLPDLQKDAEMNLRGGRFNMGFNCCRGMFTCNKGCC